MVTYQLARDVGTYGRFSKGVWGKVDQIKGVRGTNVFCDILKVLAKRR